MLLFFFLSGFRRGFKATVGVLTNPGSLLRLDMAHFFGALLVLGFILWLVRFVARRLLKRKKTLTRTYTSSGIETAEIPAPKTAIVAACVILLLFLAPYIVYRQDTHVKIFDNLDSHIPQLKVLAESGRAFSLNPQETIPNFINGIRLNGIEPGYNVITWLFMLFGPFPAYVINEFLIRFCALWGMYLLMTQRVLPGNKYKLIHVGTALAFSLVPFYPAAGLSVAGIPLLLHVFLNLQEKRRGWLNGIIIAVFPFYSKFAMTGFFILLALGAWFLYDWMRRKHFNILFFSGLVLITLFYLLTHFHLFYSFFDPGFVSYREEIKTVFRGVGECLRLSIHDLIFDTVNEGSGQQLFVIAVAGSAMIIGFLRRYRRIMLWMGVISGIIIMNSLLWGFRYWSGLGALQEQFQLLSSFNFHRFYTFNSFLWYLLFGLALAVWARQRRGVVIAGLLLLGQIAFMFINYNPQYRFMAGLQNPLPQTLTYRQFFSEKLFDGVAAYINRPKSSYRVASLGIHPAVSQYNGFYTLDVYADVYSLGYKHQFRRIIENEAARSKSIRAVFDENGKRCYLMTAELYGDKWRSEIFGRGLTADIADRLNVQDLQLNIGAFKEMGGRYIFSAVEILNYGENNLAFEKAFTHPDSAWKIYLYRAL